MKREIKFRVWNGSEMVYDIVAGKFGTFYVNPENGTGLDPKDSASLTPNNTKYFEDTPVMQFTGLKDKVDKEIYEGDIIRQEFPDMNGDMIFEICDVTFSDGQFQLDGYPLYITDDFAPEIIGNIYENPDLLEVEPKSE